MGLCRYLPTPSDRMGLLWTLLTVKESIILEYGPAGTTHYSMGFLGKLGVDHEEQIFTTHMSEEDVIMGDVSRLENSIIELDESYSPKVIFVVASSTSEVIGTDIKGVCRYMQPEVEAKLIACNIGGFRGDYSVGIAYAYNLLARELVNSTEDKLDTYNIVGLSVGNYRATADYQEIIRLLKQTYNMNIGTALCCETNITQIQNLATAKLNLVVSCEGLDCAKYMEEKFGIPYVYGMPYGYSGTKNWLTQIGEALEIKPNPIIMKELGQKIRETMHYQMYKRMLKKPMQVAIVADYDRLVGLSEFMQSLGAIVTNKICLHTLQAAQNPSPDIKYLKHEGDKIRILESLKNTFLLGDEVSTMLVNNSNTSMCVNSPTVNKSQVATHMPLIGARGADMIREFYDEYIRTL
ncbi:hypothetical protein AN639_04705 [Candidatus Epulonipiscium fishelsonii]|uniref:Uncharacterized protein n=1 Tax=Candidatus Epulonipiscium fishelsonii TaxID=77094 RepID=A0ACC8XDD5_9FIRM|nr:hypothetical protein AN639_04705 [Epulopiscium sp. SCG-B05WGA-EpuloA1]ONI40779.1 hypothetical protein AN396_05010 [Epulopiscium sp. SCG-B11WGA-EpuloA1]